MASDLRLRRAGRKSWSRDFTAVSLRNPRHGRETEVRKAPSNLAIIGRYVLTPRIFEMTRDHRAGCGRRTALTDALKKHLQA